ncbi:MAG: substrate binding domain-containing protein, partial [Pseudomonadota bacterium]
IGQRYYERATDILDDIETLEADLAEQQNLVKGRIRVAAGGLFGETWVSAQLAAFAALHPQVDIQLDITDRRVDLVREGFDLAVRHGMPSESDLIVRKLSTRRMMVCASPDYLTRRGNPDHPGDLGAHVCLAATGQRWMFQDNGRHFEVKVSSRWTSNNGAALAIASQAGLGITRLAETYCSTGIEAGTLVPLLQAFEMTPQETVLAYPSRERLPYRVRSLITFLTDGPG